MEVVFDSRTMAASNRWRAWRDAICDIYLQVDCAAEQRADYSGFVRETHFGRVTLTDALTSPQSIKRQSQHIANIGKDCYYAGIEHMGRIQIIQAGSALSLRPGVGAIYYANRPYELQASITSRQFWIELPREAFDNRFPSGRAPPLAPLDLSHGLGRIASEFCSVLATESSDLGPETKARLGEQLMDLLALAVGEAPSRQAAAETSVRQARLRSVKAYIEAHLGDPNLSLAAIAKKNGISLRYLHQLFRQTDMSASEWLRRRRLQRCRELLSSPSSATASITEIAYSMGFSSSSHFSNLFRAEFGLRPSDVRGAPARDSVDE